MKEKKKEIKKRNGYQLQYYCLGNPKDRGAWQGQRSLAGTEEPGRLFSMVSAKSWISSDQYFHFSAHFTMKRR